MGLRLTVEPAERKEETAKVPITRFEAGESILPTRVQALRHAFEAEGVVFIDSGEMAGGVVPPRK